MEYDPKTCIDAGELRASGLAVPEDIPDCAWVPRWAVKLGEPKVSLGDEAGSMTVDIPVTFTEPFKWIHVDMVIEDGRKEG